MERLPRSEKDKPFEVVAQVGFKPRKRDAWKVLLGWEWVFHIRVVWPSSLKPLNEQAAERFTYLDEMKPGWLEKLDKMT